MHGHVMVKNCKCEIGSSCFGAYKYCVLLGCDALLFIDRLLADIGMCQPNCRHYLADYVKYRTKCKP
jgi:hypothetical protein